jgi:hypothetical protein
MSEELHRGLLANLMHLLMIVGKSIKMVRCTRRVMDLLEENLTANLNGKRSGEDSFDYLIYILEQHFWK